MGLQAALPEFQKLGAEVYAITADTPQQVARAINEWKLTFIVIVDPARETIRQYGVLDANTSLAVPSTFVIDRQGIVRYRHIGTSAADRPDVQEVVEAVRKIAGASKP